MATTTHEMATRTMTAREFLDASSHALASLQSAAPRNNAFATGVYYAGVALLAVPFAPVLLLMWAAKAIDCPPQEPVAATNQATTFEDADAMVAPLLFWC